MEENNENKAGSAILIALCLLIPELFSSSVPMALYYLSQGREISVTTFLFSSWIRLGIDGELLWFAVGKLFAFFVCYAGVRTFCGSDFECVEKSLKTLGIFLLAYEIFRVVGNHFYLNSTSFEHFVESCYIRYIRSGYRLFGYSRKSQLAYSAITAVLGCTFIYKGDLEGYKVS